MGAFSLSTYFLADELNKLFYKEIENFSFYQSPLMVKECTEKNITIISFALSMQAAVLSPTFLWWPRPPEIRLFSMYHLEFVTSELAKQV